MSIGWTIDGAPAGPAGGDVGGTYPDALIVQALQGVPLSVVPPSAVGQILKWNGAALEYTTNFGENFNYAQRLTPLGTTLPPPGTLYLSHTTPVLPAGTYYMGVSTLVGGSSSNTQIAANLFVDGVNRSGPLNETGIANGRYVFGSPFTEVFTAGTHTIEIRIGLAGGAGTVTAFVANILIWRAT